MKRFCVLVACALLCSMITGCGDSGLDEGMPKNVPAEAQTTEFKAEILKNAGNMKMRKPANPPAAK